LPRKLSKRAGPPTELEFEKALMFFHAYMYGPLQGKLRLYKARDVRPAGKVMPSDWEVFASILVRDVGKKLSSGVDLSGNEVKSAEKGGSFEYQYHKKAGKQKLLDDMSVGHLFFEHDNNLRWVELRYLHGTALREFFEKWSQEYPDPYPQRYRRSISNGFVRKNGTLLMRLIDGEVEYPELRSAKGEEVSAQS
jgi:hypothetical protein